MVEQQLMKVYELAKELGVDSISLLDKLNHLNIRVKNHMSDLGPEEVRTARESLGKKETSAKAATPKKTAVRSRKKATTDSAAADKTPKESAAAPAEKRAAAPVIRRRVKADGATETVSTTVTRQMQGSSMEAIASAEGSTAAAYNADESAAGVMEAGYAEDSAAEADQAHLMDQESLQAETEPTSAAAATAAQQEAHPAAGAPAGTAVTGGQIADLGATSEAGKQTDTQAKQRPPVVLPPRPVAPRRSILKIVEPTAPVRPNIVKAAPPLAGGQKATMKGTATQDKDGFRIIKMTKENLDQMVEEEAAKKRGGGREMELRPEDVRFADYRKKEMVFLPKKKKIPVGKELKKTQKTTPKAIKRVVEMREAITVQDLANQLNVKAVDVIRKLMGLGQMATINQSLDFDTATLVANEYQFEVKNIAFNEGALLDTTEDQPDQLVSRPPVVTIMGHVDHGKTSLLDAIREANVAGDEAGGITQHIGAYTVEKEGKLITFIDTPGHEAFTVMRARGANVTDIVILVVAADDGVMPQTREALSHAQAANVPIIVAVNKIDKPGANPDKVKQALAELNLLAEDWGGQTMFVPVSALKRTNLDKLLESILLQAEVLDLKANSDARANGTVLEARLEKGRGPVVSLLVRRGTLRVGDALVAGPIGGKVKAMTDDKGRNVHEAGPAIAVEVLGFEGVPNAGERFDAPATEADARKIAASRVEKERAKSSVVPGKVSLDQLFAKIQTGNIKELNVVLKADVYGSIEAIRDSLTKASTDQVKVKVIMAAPGGITESDVMLASASNAIIIGFNVRPETKARQLAESEHVEIKCYGIIYELIDDIKKSMAGLLDKKKVEKFLGRAEVRQTFTVPKVGTIAGSAVIDGKIIRGANVRLLRDSRVIFEGKMSSLRRFKDDAKEVASGFECGIGIENYNDLKPGDVIEAFQIELVTPELMSSPS